MELGTPLLAVGGGERAASFDLFGETLEPEWIAQALTATGVVVIGMGLPRDRSIREVVRHLGNRSTDRPFFGHAGRARRAGSRKWALAHRTRVVLKRWPNINPDRATLPADVSPSRGGWQQAYRGRQHDRGSRSGSVLFDGG